MFSRSIYRLRVARPNAGYFLNFTTERQQKSQIIGIDFCIQCDLDIDLCLKIKYMYQTFQTRPCTL
jgi:hypothetical protein